MMGQKRWQGTVQVLAAALLWSSAGLLIRGVACSTFWLLAIRSGAAALALAPSLRQLCGHKIGRNGWLAIWLYAAFMFAFALATRLTSASQAVAGQYTAPLFIYLFSVVRGKIRVRPINLLPMLCIALGCGLSLFAGTTGPLVLLPLACGLLFPAYSAFLRRAGDLPAGAVNCLGNLACAVLALPFAISTPLPVLGDTALIAVAGVAVNGFGYTLYARGARQVASLTAVMLCLAEPLLNPVWVFLFLGEAPTPAGAVSLLLILAGGFLDVAGAWLRSLQTRRNARL